MTFQAQNSLGQFKLYLWFKYCGIIIVNGGPMLVAFIGNPCPQIDFSTTVTHIVQAFVKCFFFKLSLTCYQRNYIPRNQDTFVYPQTLTSTYIDNTNTTQVNQCATGLLVTFINYTDTKPVIQCVTRLPLSYHINTTSLNAQIIKVYVQLSSPLVFNFFALQSVRCLTNRQSLNNQVWPKTMNLLHVFQFQMISAMYRREGEWMSNIC